MWKFIWLTVEKYKKIAYIDNNVKVRFVIPKEGSFGKTILMSACWAEEELDTG